MEITYYRFDPVFWPDIKLLADITPPDDWETTTGMYCSGLFGSSIHPGSDTSSFGRTSSAPEYMLFTLDMLKIK